MNAAAPLKAHQAWRPALSGPVQANKVGPWRPARLPFNPNLRYPNLGQVAGRALAIGTLLVPTAIAAATAYVGFRLGSKDEGIPSVLGYVVGSLGVLGTLAGLLASLGVAIFPSNLFTTPATGQPIVPQEV